MDYSGCGNTLNCNHPIAEKLIVDCLEYWVRRDARRRLPLRRGLDPRARRGRRADGPSAGHLADRAVARRWPTPRSSPRPGTPPGCTRSATSPATAGPSGTASYRDDIRRFVKGDAGHGRRGRLAASPARADLYQTSGHLPINSINFITCHDGFTLNDLVSYNEKHNEANGEGNNDGVNDNMSWNCGVEGPTDDPGDRGAARAADQELRRDADAVAGRADVRGRRRGPPHPAGQQQRLLPGQRDQLVRLVPAEQQRATCCGSSSR